MKEFLKQSFAKFPKLLTAQLASVLMGTMKAATANTYQIARELSKLNNKTFKANQKLLARFLQNSSLQIDDKLWRAHVQLIFKHLKQSSLIEPNQAIQINVDATTIEDRFLVLSASIVVFDKAITLYFSMRKYPKKSGAISYKKLEEAFIKALKHVLSKRYSYIIVADRGFGNGRFAKLCQSKGFDYVLRLNGDLKINLEGKSSKLNEHKEDSSFEAEVVSWGQKAYFTVSNKAGMRWYLVSNKASIGAKECYQRRFKIEKNYQELKSSGYDIEKSKIKKYDRFKRLLYITVLAHGLTCLLGRLVSQSKNRIKKKLYSMRRFKANLSIFKVGYMAIKLYFHYALALLAKPRRLLLIT